MIIEAKEAKLSTFNYAKIFEFLKTKFGSCYDNEQYYQRITEWQDLYKGYVKAYHDVAVQNGVSTAFRKAATLHMAKRIAEDWTAVLLADTPIINIDGKNKSVSRFIQGSKGDGGVLGSNNFEEELNTHIERSFALGTTACVVGVSKELETDSEYRIDLNFYDAMAIIPIKYHNNVITDCAFLSKFMKDGKTYYNLSCHVRNEAKQYVIYNYEATDDLNFASYLNRDVEGLETKSETPLFFIFKPQLGNNVDLDSPLGVSVYSDSVDVVVGCDFMYDAVRQDVFTGQRIILMDKSLLGRDESGNLIPPQDYKKWCMSFVDDEGAAGMEKFVKDFSPDLHCTDLTESLQNSLNLLSMRCGLGNNYYNFDKVAGVTATEFVGSQQDLIRNAKLNLKVLNKFMVGIIKQILWVGSNILNYPLAQDAKVNITIPDGIVTNDIAEKAQDRLDVELGVMSLAEYRAKWYGETLEDAQKKIDEMQAKSKEDNKDVEEDTTKDTTKDESNPNETEQEDS